MPLQAFLPLLSLMVLAYPVTPKAAAWLKPEGLLEIHYEHVRSSHNETFQGVHNDYKRETKQLYAEYGLSRKYTITYKNLTGMSGIGAQSEAAPFGLNEMTVRSALNLKNLKLLPLGIKPLWSLLSPSPPTRISVASIDLGFGEASNNGSYLITQVTGSEKIETTHTHPISIFMEISINYQKYQNSDQGLKALSRLELGHRNYFLAYERLDGRFWGHSEFNEHFWFAELGIPLSKTIMLTVKRGHERTLPDVPRERANVLGLRLKIP